MEQQDTKDAQPLVKHYAAKSLSVDLKERTVKHWITTTTIDDDGDVLLPRGCDMSRFVKSGTVFDVHEYGTQNVIGKNVGLEVADRGIIALTRFSQRPPKDLLPESQPWLPDVSLWLHHTGDVSGWSVGFDQLEVRPPSKKDKEEFGDSDAFKQVHCKWRLLEYSQAPIPANEDAINLAVKSGRISERLAKRLESGDEVEQVAKEWIPKPKRTVVVVSHVEPKRKQTVVFPILEFGKRAKPEDSLSKAVRIAIAKASGKIDL